MMPPFERRARRSNARFRAAELYLEALTRSGAARAVALSDDTGVLVGSAPGRCDLDELVRAARHDRTQRRRDLRTHPVELGGRVHFLTLLCGSQELDDPARLDASLERAETALTRILA